MMKEWNKGVPPLCPQPRDGESINVTYTPMNIEDLKARQYEKYLQRFAVVSIDAHTTLALVQELRESANAIESLQRELEEARKDAENYKFLRDSMDNSLHLTRNGDHTCNYVTAKEWIERYTPEDFAEDAPEEVEAMKASNTIWRLQIYPNTPIGFNAWHGSTLDAVINAARQPPPNTPTTKPDAT